MFTKIQMLESTYKMHCESANTKARLLAMKKEKVLTVYLNLVLIECLNYEFVTIHNIHPYNKTN